MTNQITERAFEVAIVSKQESMGEEEDDIEDNICKSMRARGKQPNLSFFAFTATPKPKTLEDFGHMNAQGQTEPFHLYSMRQAIEEGFIMDVLQNYTTYRTYFKISKAIADDPNISKKKTSRAIAKFLSLHPHNLAQKTEVIVEHFRQIEEALVQDNTLSQQAKSNSIENFKYGFEDVFLTKLIERMDLNQDIFTKIIDFKDFGEVVKDWMLRKVYTRLIQEFISCPPNYP